ncbi:SHP1 [[Candida] subhashii]|uniref:SHP1 n=1 Tax=[Candida] subhashii TaxID=561895 RepID=A0A8J5V424_9ASCO|nr:SHP1 [[Candida] subhashii]KAG7664894.1 SHP1 [[Candida] subhashii]
MSDKAAEESIEEFVAITNSSRYLAEQYLQRNDNDVVEAVEDYYANKDPSSTPSSQRGTLRDLNAPEGDDSDDDKPGMNYFTGGEKSGLQVENPNKDKKSGNDSLIDQIFQRAKEQMTQPDDRPSAASGENEPKQPKFTGRGFKLGDSNEPSQEIPDLSSSRFPRPPNKVTRQITFWKQGFTVGEDGPLYRYDDPRNTNVLQELNQGRVPISILDVEFGQDVDVSVFKKTDEEWTPPKRKVAGYFGTGHRLGSPVPGEPLNGTATPTEIPAEVPKPTEPEGEALRNHV